MDSNKLAKVMQMLIAEEIKKSLPTLVDEAVRKQLKTILSESVNSDTPKRSEPRKERSDISDKEKKMRIAMMKKKASMAGSSQKNNVKRVKSESVNNDKTSVFKEILKETKPFNTEQLSGDGSMYFNSKDVHSIGNKRSSRVSMDGDAMDVPFENTGIPQVDNALNRDYSELMAMIDKKKGKA